jgi:hypothetical protein
MLSRKQRIALGAACAAFGAGGLVLWWATRKKGDGGDPVRPARPEYDVFPNVVLEPAGAAPAGGAGCRDACDADAACTAYVVGPDGACEIFSQPRGQLVSMAKETGPEKKRTAAVKRAEKEPKSEWLDWKPCAKCAIARTRDCSGRQPCLGVGSKPCPTPVADLLGKFKRWQGKTDAARAIEFPAGVSSKPVPVKVTFSIGNPMQLYMLNAQQSQDCESFAFMKRVNADGSSINPGQDAVWIKLARDGSSTNESPVLACTSTFIVQPFLLVPSPQ